MRGEHKSRTAGENEEAFEPRFVPGYRRPPDKDEPFGRLLCTPKLFATLFILPPPRPASFSPLSFRSPGSESRSYFAYFAVSSVSFENPVDDAQLRIDNALCDVRSMERRFRLVEDNDEPLPPGGTGYPVGPRYEHLPMYFAPELSSTVKFHFSSVGEHVFLWGMRDREGNAVSRSRVGDF